MAHLRSLVLAAACALLATPSSARSDVEWLTLQAGKFTGHSSTTGDRDLSQRQFGLRLHNDFERTPYWETVSEVAV